LLQKPGARVAQPQVQGFVAQRRRGLVVELKSADAYASVGDYPHRGVQRLADVLHKAEIRLPQRHRGGGVVVGVPQLCNAPQQVLPIGGGLRVGGKVCARRVKDLFHQLPAQQQQLPVQLVFLHGQPTFCVHAQRACLFAHRFRHALPQLVLPLVKLGGLYFVGPLDELFAVVFRLGQDGGGNDLKAFI